MQLLQDLAHNRFSAGYPRALGDAPKLALIAFQHRGVHYRCGLLLLLRRVGWLSGVPAVFVQTQMRGHSVRCRACCAATGRASRAATPRCVPQGRATCDQTGMTRLKPQLLFCIDSLAHLAPSAPCPLLCSDPAVALRDAVAPTSPRLTGALAAAVLEAVAAQPGVQPLPGAVLELVAPIDLPAIV